MGVKRTKTKLATWEGKPTHAKLTKNLLGCGTKGNRKLGRLDWERLEIVLAAQGEIFGSKGEEGRSRKDTTWK